MMNEIWSCMTMEEREETKKKKINTFFYFFFVFFSCFSWYIRAFKNKNLEPKRIVIGGM